MLYPGQSSVEARFTLPSIPPGVNLSLLHCTSSLWPKPGYAPVNIFVNGTTFQDHYDVATRYGGERDYRFDRFTIPATALVAGSNTVRIQLQSGARTHYWIRSLGVEGML
jgi:hypothetical protein